MGVIDEKSLKQEVDYLTKELNSKGIDEGILLSTKVSTEQLAVAKFLGSEIFFAFKSEVHPNLKIFHCLFP